MVIICASVYLSLYIKAHAIGIAIIYRQRRDIIAILLLADFAAHRVSSAIAIITVDKGVKFAVCFHYRVN